MSLEQDDWDSEELGVEKRWSPDLTLMDEDALYSSAKHKGEHDSLEIEESFEARGPSLFAHGINGCIRREVVSTNGHADNR
jgi:hypothetical protein